MNRLPQTILLDSLKVLIITASIWAVFLSKLISFEAVFLFFALLAIAVFRRPFSEAKVIPWPWFFVLLGFFILMSLFPMLWYMPFGDSSYSLMNTRFTTLLVFLYVWVLFWQLKPSEDVIWWALIFASLAVLFAIVYELYVLGSYEAIFTHRFGNAATPHVLRFGIYSNLLTVILLGGFIWATRKSAWVVLALTVAALITFVGSLVSDTRSAWAGLPEALVVWAIFYWLYFRRHEQINVKRTVLLWSFFLVSFISILFYFGDRLEKRWNAMTGDLTNYVEGTGNAGSVGKRLVMYEAGIKGFVDNFWVGVGVDNSEEVQLELTRPIMKEIYNIDQGFSKTHLHNQFIQEAFTRGIWGLLGFVITLGYLVVYFSMRAKDLKRRGVFSPWPVAGALFVVSSSISMLAEAWVHLRSGVVFFMFMATLFVFLTHRETLADKESEKP